MNEQYYRVLNKCKHSIGVQLMNGIQVNIKPGSFQMLTGSDILYIESVCVNEKFFSQKMLVPVDNMGNPVALESLGMPEDPDVPKHMMDEEIVAMLKKTPKQIEAWLADITDPAELHSIYKVAKNTDITKAKLQVLSNKMPDKDWLDREEDMGKD